MGHWLGWLCWRAGARLQGVRLLPDRYLGGKHPVWVLQAGLLEACVSPRVAASPLQLVLLLLLAHPTKPGKGDLAASIPLPAPRLLTLHLWSLSSAELYPVTLVPVPAVMVACAQGWLPSAGVP